MPDPSPADRPRAEDLPAGPGVRRGSPVLWVGSTYFAEGLPLMIVRKLSSVFYTDIGVDLRTIGHLNFLGNAWNLKFLWAPLLDILGTKRRWLVTMQFLIGLLTLCVAIAASRMPAAGLGVRTQQIVFLTSILFLVTAVLSATNDIASDAYYMEGIRDAREQAAHSGERVLAYRLAIVYANFGLVALASLGASRVWGWTASFTVAGLTMLVLAAAHHLWLPRVETALAKPSLRDVGRTFANAFLTYVRQPRAAVVLGFVLTYKADEFLFSMNTPFLMRELAVTKTQYAWMAGLVGAASTVAGALLAAWWIKRTGFRRALWPLTLLMNLSIWAYVALAYLRPSGGSRAELTLIAAVNGYEHLAAGLGNTALIVYLLRTCRPEFKAAHFAIGTALMSVPANVLGGFAGRIVEQLGWVGFFVLCFLVTLPSMLLIPWLPHKDEPPDARTDPATR
jgi:MFS transporter, PAT family, beta-lactamase induction signal transducer AmpG